MKKGLVRDAGSALAVAKALDVLRGCDDILREHIHRASVGVYGKGIWAPALEYDLLTLQARLEHVRMLIAGWPESGEK